MYALTSLRRASFEPQPATTRTQRPRTTDARRRRKLFHPLDDGRAAVGVAEDELHESLVRREPAGARAAAELRPLLLQGRADRERGEAAGWDLDALHAQDPRRAGDAE